MKKILALFASFACALALLPAHAAATDGRTASDNAAIVKAANAFLASLGADQRKQVVYAFDDEVQRARWSNFPTGMVPRGGISFKQMNAAQRDAAGKLLAVVFSPAGLAKLDAIRQADDDFKGNGAKRGPLGPGGPGGRAFPGGPPPDRGARPDGPPGLGAPGKRPPFLPDDLFGSDLYFISFLGQPALNGRWMLQFGGHHLALNVTFSGPASAMTPSLTGAQPASFTAKGKTIRPLGNESDKALALLQSLDEKQRKQAVLGYAVGDLVLGPGQDGKRIVPEGLKASDMSAPQQARLLDLIGEWAGIMNEGAAAARMAEMKADLRATWFAWSGPVDASAGSNITAYYRIQGPHLVIEYAPQADEPNNHVHTIYRDPTKDYGRAPPAR